MGDVIQQKCSTLDEKLTAIAEQQKEIVEAVHGILKEIAIIKGMIK